MKLARSLVAVGLICAGVYLIWGLAPTLLVAGCFVLLDLLTD